MPETERTPHVMRVGWSTDLSSFQVGEDTFSYGYGGTGKCSVNNKFFDYGEPYSCNDIITCYLDLDANPKAIFFAKNGKYMNVAFRLGPELNGQALYPHVTVKNMRFTANFGNKSPYFPLTQGFSLLEWLQPQTLIRGSVAPRSRQECEVIMMVGLPASGKTVWAIKYAEDHKEKKYNILGTNAIMDRMKVMGLMRKRNYHGRWDALIKQATDILNQVFKIAERKNRNYILDQTNVYPNARRRKMNNFRGYHRTAAVLVNTNAVLKQRAEKREREEGKIVPESAVMEMKANFTLPEVGEVFDDVWFLEEDNISAVRLVEEFRNEGRVFKDADKKRKAEENKRVTPSPNYASELKKPRVNPMAKAHSTGPPQQRYNQHESRGTPNVGSRSAPPPPGAYGAQNTGLVGGYNNYGPPARPLPAHNNHVSSYGCGPTEQDDKSRVLPPHDYGRMDNYGSWQGRYGDQGLSSYRTQPVPLAQVTYNQSSASSAQGWQGDPATPGFSHVAQGPGYHGQSFNSQQSYTTPGYQGQSHRGQQTAPPYRGQERDGGRQQYGEPSHNYSAPYAYGGGYGQ